MKSSAVLQGLVAVCIAATASAVSGQNAIQLFSPANVRVSTQGTGHGDDAKTFNSTILNLKCASPIHAVLSSSPDGNGNVLVDNFVSLSVNGATPVDICKNGTSEENGDQQNCFNATYASEAQRGQIDWAGSRTVWPVPEECHPSISAATSRRARFRRRLQPWIRGAISPVPALYLVTNCTNEGISGPGNITGNPIPSSNPNGQQLTQNYAFSSSNNLQVQFTYDLSEAKNSGTLSIPDGSTPSTANTPIDPGHLHQSLSPRHVIRDRELPAARRSVDQRFACLQPLHPHLPGGYEPHPKRRFVPGIAGTQRILSGSLRRPQLYPSRYRRHERHDVPSRGGFPGSDRRMGRRDLRFRLLRRALPQSALPAECADELFGSWSLQDRWTGTESELRIHYRSPGAQRI